MLCRLVLVKWHLNPQHTDLHRLLHERVVLSMVPGLSHLHQLSRRPISLLWRLANLARKGPLAHSNRAGLKLVPKQANTNFPNCKICGRANFANRRPAAANRISPAERPSALETSCGRSSGARFARLPACLHAQQVAAAAGGGGE